MKIETSNERYNRVLEFFKKELSRNPTVRLDDCCRQQYTNFSGMETWLYRQGISVRELREAAKVMYEEAFRKASIESSTGFVTLLPPPGVYEEELQGVNVTLSDGTIVSIRKCTPTALRAFIKEYNWTGKGVEECSH